MKAIEQIIAGYISLKDHRALNELLNHRRRLLEETRMHSVPGFNPSTVIDTLQEEINLVEAALARLEIAPDAP